MAKIIKCTNGFDVQMCEYADMQMRYNVQICTLKDHLHIKLRSPGGND